MRKLAIACCAFSAGVFLSHYLLPESWLFPAALILFLSGTILVPLRRRWLLPVVLTLCASAAGLYLYGMNGMIKGNLVQPYDGETLTLDAADVGKVSAGDYVVNLAFVPDEVVVRNCTAVNCKSRVVVQAAQRVEISGCRLDHVLVHVSSALRVWGEGGGVENIDIHHNEILMTPDPASNRDNRPAIWIRVNDAKPTWVDVNDTKPFSANKAGETPPQTRYRNLRIHDNVIDGWIDVANCDGVEIFNNQFVTPREDAVIVQPNCSDVRIG